MNFETDRELDQFAFRFLENRGAVIERNNAGFEALLPPTLSELLGISEHIRISDGKDSPSKDHYSISYGAPLLEKMVEAACGQFPLITCRFEFDYLKSQGFDRLIKDQFNFYKSTGKIESSGTVKTYYL
ncbi:MAG: hypothetical protein JRJ08_02545, partial [Deltaproteobacteria bacterium]|nr:hypothetical protein [Deltaproteobacteria bacterium]